MSRTYRLLLFLFTVLFLSSCQAGETTTSPLASSPESRTVAATEGKEEQQTSHNIISENASEVEVRFGLPEWEIVGTLSLPDEGNHLPAVILVGGSGPTDRDGTILQNKPYRDIAAHLVHQGVAVLRYDKRTLTHKEKLLSPRSASGQNDSEQSASERPAERQSKMKADDITIYDEVIEDAVFAFEKLKEFPQIDASRIYYIGHSLGGNQLPRIAEKVNPRGLIIMAGNVSPMQQLIYRQSEYLLSLEKDPAKELKLATIKKFVDYIESPNFGPDSSKELSFHVSPRYWMDLRDYNPAVHLRALIQEKTVTSDILILQGGRDYQVNLSEYKLWEQELADIAQFQLFPHLNHLFMNGTGPASPAEYSVPSTVSPEVTDRIIEFIRQSEQGEISGGDRR